MKANPSIVILIIGWILMSIFSFTLRDTNLTIYNISFLQNLQSTISEFGYTQRPLNTVLFISITSAIWLSYLSVIKQNKSIIPKTLILGVITIAAIGIISYPLFSHDIFNYLFNAKMILVYGANPHIQTALEFAQDPWTRFMHNIHTPAPYAYGWTGISLLPMIITVSNFTLSFWGMKLFVSIFFLMQAYLIYKMAQLKFPKQAKTITTLFALNPLFIMETFFIGHNDSVMMALALASIYFLLKFDHQQQNPSQDKNYKNKESILLLSSAMALYIASVAIKYATIVLAPFLILRKKIDLFTWGGIALLAVLLSRPEQLHSWYLQWGLSLLLLSKYQWSRLLFIGLSFAGMLRYAPFIYYGNWDPPVPALRWILLLAPLALLAIKPVRQQLKKCINGI